MAIRILVVDDTKFMRLMLTDMLRKLEFEVVGEAESGYQAIQLYTELKPDIVMLDITMPELDGIGALKELRRINPECVVVICSAMSQQDLISEAIKAGANDYVVKPFAAARVKEVLDKMIPLLPVRLDEPKVEAILEAETEIDAQPKEQPEAATVDPIVERVEPLAVSNDEPELADSAWSIRPFQSASQEAENPEDSGNAENAENAEIVEKIEQQELAFEDTSEYSSETWYQSIPDTSTLKSAMQEAAATSDSSYPQVSEELSPQSNEEPHIETSQEVPQYIRQEALQETAQQEAIEQEPISGANQAELERAESIPSEPKTKMPQSEAASGSSNIVLLHQDGRGRRGPNRLRNFNSSYMCNWSEEIKGEEIDYQVICSVAEDRISIIAVKDGDKCQNINFSISGYQQLVDWLEDKIGNSLHVLQDEQL
jgi:YesN/AraC family two-component response regulator